MSTTKPAGPVIRWYYCLFPFLLATEPSKSGHAARTWSIWPTALPGKSNSRPASECVRTRARTKARTHECKPAQAHTDALAHPHTHARILTHKHARTRAHLSSQFLACWHTHSASQRPAPTCDRLSSAARPTGGARASSAPPESAASSSRSTPVKPTWLATCVLAVVPLSGRPAGRGPPAITARLSAGQARRCAGR